MAFIFIFDRVPWVQPQILRDGLVA